MLYINIKYVCVCMFEMKLLPTPTQQENLVLTDSQPWFLLVVQIPYDSFEFTKSTCFFVRTNLTSHWISISTLQALSKCHHPSWIGQSFSNPTASWISARTSPTIRATACLQSSSASCDANLAKSLEKAEVLQKSSSWNVRVLYLLGTSNTHTSSQIVSQNSNGVFQLNIP